MWLSSNQLLHVKEVYSHIFTHKLEKSWGGGFSERSVEMWLKSLSEVCFSVDTQNIKSSFIIPFYKQRWMSSFGKISNWNPNFQWMAYSLSLLTMWDGWMTMINKIQNKNKCSFKDIICIFLKCSLFRNDPMFSYHSTGIF